MTKEEIKNYVDEIDNNPNINLLFIFTSNIDETIKFILESSDKEFEVMADYFLDIAYITESKDFIEAIRTRFINMKDNSLDLKYICDEIKAAEDVFEAEEY